MRSSPDLRQRVQSLQPNYFSARMDATTTTHLPDSRPLWVKILLGFVVLVAAIALLLVFFPWDVLRGPLNRYVSEKTGRHFEITRRLDVKLGRTTRVIADGLEFANPEWAVDKYLVKAEGGEVDVELWPLLRRKIELPRIMLHKPQLGLQVDKDGRRTWALGRDHADPSNLPNIGALVVDEGTAHYVATHQGADINTQFAIDGSAGAGGNAEMPLSFKANGSWQKERFTATGRTGNVLYLNAANRKPFPMQISAQAGGTSLNASGSVANLSTMDGANAKVEIKGANLAELYNLLGVVLPETPRYIVSGQVTNLNDVWAVQSLQGKLGNTDLAGELSYDRSQARPLLAGNLTSKTLDFDDLAPLVGLPERPRSAAAVKQVKLAADSSTPAKKSAKVARPVGKVLPNAQLDTTRLKAMNADVSYSAARITHPQQLPLESMSLRVKLQEGVMLLDAMRLGVAAGTLQGTFKVDANTTPASAEAHLDARALELGRLFPTLKITKGSFGKISGDIDLKGKGNSVAQMLGTSSGNVVMLMGRGEVSNLLMEFAGLDGAEIVKFLVGGDENVVLRCGGVGFDVKSGLMSTRALVLDTEDTVIYGEGAVSLANETLDFTLRPYPKDMSILSLRSPLKLTGSFSAPRASIDKGAVAGRAGIALALGAINPLLALAATVETGPGKDANCSSILKAAASPYASAKMNAMANVQEQGAAMSAPAAKPSFFDRLFGRTPAPAAPVAPARP